ncbi:MAG: DUF2156 domain-containing protein [Rubrobacteraceae bacterium]|nr:DUF2156 domain-containing protein [Rubrobacteraceae bacterium]
MRTEIKKRPLRKRIGPLVETLSGHILPCTARRWAVRLVALAALYNGVLEILWVQIVRVPERNISSSLPFGLHYWNRTLSLVFGLALVYLSLNLWRRKRVAWQLATASSAAIIVGHLFFRVMKLYRGVPHHVHHPEHWFVVPALTLALLLAFRGEFTVRSEPRSMKRGLLLMGGSLLFALAYGTLGFWLLDRRDFGTNFRLAASFVQTLRAYALLGTGLPRPRTAQAEWFLDSLGWTGLMSGAFAAYSLFRPLSYRYKVLPHERERAGKLLHRYGGTSLDYFKLQPDKSYFFSKDGSAFVAYGVARGVALVLGDPSGRREAFAGLVKDFLDFCTDNGWMAAFYEAEEHLLPLYESFGMQAVLIGEEAIVDLARFGERTSHRKWFRYVVRRLEREGYTFERAEPPHRGPLLSEVEEVSRAWLSLPGRRERGFTIGSFSPEYVGGTPLFLVRDPDGRVVAFANEVPSYKEGEATIDLMRHRPEVPNGTMDYLLTKTMLHLRERGYRTFDLGLAPLSGTGGRPGAPLEERILGQLSEPLTRFFSYKGLKNYKAKFEPRWERRFLVYRGRLSGPTRVVLALVMLTEGG